MHEQACETSGTNCALHWGTRLIHVQSASFGIPRPAMVLVLVAANLMDVLHTFLILLVWSKKRVSFVARV